MTSRPRPPRPRPPDPRTLARTLARQGGAPIPDRRSPALDTRPGSWVPSLRPAPSLRPRRIGPTTPDATSSSPSALPRHKHAPPGTMARVLEVQRAKAGVRTAQWLELVRDLAPTLEDPYRPTWPGGVSGSPPRLLADTYRKSPAPSTVDCSVGSKPTLALKRSLLPN